MNTETEALPVEDETEAQPEPVAARVPVRKYTIVNVVDAAQLQRDLSYSLVDLSSAMQQQASLYVHYALLAAKASKQVDDVEMLLEVTESKVDRTLRDKAAVLGNKTTESQLDKQVRLHPQVIAIRRALNEAKQIEAVAKAAAKGFEQRRDMLIQHGASERKERDGELRTMGPRAIRTA